MDLLEPLDAAMITAEVLSEPLHIAAVPRRRTPPP